MQKKIKKSNKISEYKKILEIADIEASEIIKDEIDKIVINNMIQDAKNEDFKINSKEELIEKYNNIILNLPTSKKLQKDYIRNFTDNEWLIWIAGKLYESTLNWKFAVDNAKSERNKNSINSRMRRFGYSENKII